MARPKKYIVHLSDETVSRLKSLLKKKDTSETICNRCRILLDMDEAHPPVLKQADCAKAHGICRATVSNTIAAYCKEGLEQVLQLKRNANSDNARRKVDGRAEARIVAVACGPAPDGRSRWTLRLLEEQMKIELDEPVGKDAIRRALKKTNFSLTSRITGVSLPKQTQSS